MNNTNSNSSCALNNSNMPSPVHVPNVQSPNSSQLSVQSKMTDSHQSIDDQIQQRAQPNAGQLHAHQQPQSVFTIEQIELIRRLRKTNLTINQFVEAYREMERLEEEMSDKKDLSFDNTASSITYALNHSNLSNSQHLAHQPLLPGNCGDGNLYSSNSHNQLASLTNHYNSLPHSHPSQALNNSALQSADDNVELINFKKKGEAQVMAEIKQFVSKYNVRQSMISEATGISQGYISTFFHGEKMSEKRKNIIYQWYLTYSKNPGKLNNDRQQISLNSSNNSKFSQPDFGSDNSNHFGANNEVLFPITRRDRFIFRKQHLKILETFFESNPYPEIHTKEQIVEECNLSAEKSSGKPLKEADKVTVAIVSNWFNNRRKNARSKHLKSQQYSGSTGNSSLGNLALSSHSLNSSTGSANLSQSSNPGYLNNLPNSPSPVSSANAYLSIQQSHHQMQQQQNHQQPDANSFEQSNYGYGCNSYNTGNSTPNNQAPSGQNQQNSVHCANIVRNPSNAMQFKNEPDYNYMDGSCFNKLPPNASSTNSKSDNDDVDLAQDHDGSNISEFSSQSFNGDSIDN